MKIHTLNIGDYPLRVDTELLGKQLYALIRARPTDYTSENLSDKELLSGLETFISELRYHLTKED